MCKLRDMCPAVVLTVILFGGTAQATTDVRTVSEGPEWVPFSYLHEIEPGTALDFSDLGLHHRPAGKFGWLAGRDGHAAFEKRPNVPARFYGVNLCGDANTLTDGEIERLTDRLVRLGYNALRLHHHDDLWQKDTDGARLKMDRLIAACVRKGIYLTTDLYVSRKVTWRELGEDRDGLADAVKIRMMTTEAGFDCWKKYATEFLTHVNPLTGRALKDEPAMPFLVIVNESSPHSGWDRASRVEAFRALWKVWLDEVRRKHPGCFPGLTAEAFPSRGGWWNPGAEANAVGSFWTWCMERFSKRAAAFLKDELGVKALLSTENNGPVLPEILRARADAGDYVDVHWYTEHAGPASKEDRKKTGLHLTGVFRNHNPLCGGTDCYSSRAFSRVWGRPMTVSESNMGGPNVHRAVHGLAIGSYAAVQDWSGIWTFAMAHGSRKAFDGCTAPPGRFDLGLDPLLQASDRMAVLLFLRGDLATPSTGFAHCLTADDMTPAARERLSSCPDWARAVPELAWRTRLGVSFGLTPTGVVDVCVGKAAPDVGGVPSSGVTIDRKKGNLTVETERFAGGFVSAGESLSAGPLSVRVQDTRTCVAVASLSGSALRQAPRLLLWHLTDLHGDGFCWGGACHRPGIGRHTGILNWGSGEKLLARTGRADVSLQLDRAADYEVWSLDSVGRRQERIAAHAEGDRLQFTVAIAPNQGKARLYYEIVAP